jgi:hypothetical protein
MGNSPRRGLWCAGSELKRRAAVEPSAENEEMKKMESDLDEENLLCSFLRESKKTKLGLRGPAPPTWNWQLPWGPSKYGVITEYGVRKSAWLLRRGPPCVSNRQPSDGRTCSFPLFLPLLHPRPAFPTCCARTRGDRVRWQRIFWAAAGSFHPPPIPVTGAEA